jgi:two-component system, LytTR family, sensor kinase
MEQRVILVNQLVKLGVAAAIASAQVRSVWFKGLLFKEERTTAEKIRLALFIGAPFALGVLVRASVKNFLSADMSFEATILIGVIGGRVAGVVGGGFVALPGLLHGEWLGLPFNLLAGLIAGMLRNLAGVREDIWSFSPFIDLSVYRWIRRNLPRPKLDWQIMFFFTIIVLRLARQALARQFPNLIFSVDSPNWPVEVAIYATAIVSIAIALKIWNNTRIEMKLEEQHRALLQARMEALQNQINPHFLFNTLASISSLIRTQPETARMLVTKLSGLLRRLLRSTDHFVTLREELDAIDEYLHIEVIRFGPQLNVDKQIHPATLDVIVPSLILQPLVENSIKHGLSPKVGGGRITIKSALRDGHAIIEVVDDGLGMTEERLAHALGGGIGLSNVNERLRTIYGAHCQLKLKSVPGAGTSVSIEIPELAIPERVIA